MTRTVAGLALFSLLGASGFATGCSPQDVLAQQGSTLRSTDYVQVAVNAEKKKQAEREAQEKKQQQEREAIQKVANRAQAHMDLFEYEAAIEDFKEAYRLSNDPQYLVRIAEAERTTGDCAEARTFYQQYLDKAKNATDASFKPLAIEARIAEAKSCETKAGSRIGEVRKYYQDGVTHYNLAEYADAVKAFKEAYRISQDSAYLFNIAQSYRMARNCSDAMQFYQKLLQVEPEYPNKAKVEGRIEEMRACAKK